jgi:hypothetical protein
MPGKWDKRTPSALSAAARKSRARISQKARIAELEKENRQLRRLLLELSKKPARLN